MKISSATYISAEKTKWKEAVPTLADSENVAQTEKVKSLKGKIDLSIVGIWVCKDTILKGDWKRYSFFEDGSFELYEFTAKPIPGISKSEHNTKGHWRIDGDFIELLYQGNNTAERAAFRKKNNPLTGKPKIVVRYFNLVNLEYESQDNKKPW